MRIALVSIGEEVLRGQVVNTNAAFLGRQLFLAGYSVSSQVTLVDEREGLKAGLKWAMDGADVVIATGGLGPTLDDITRSVAAELFGCGFRVDGEVEANLKARYGQKYFAVGDQVRVPEKARVVINHVGSAPGLIFHEGGKVLVLLPGVPREMKPLFLDGVLPFLKEEFPVKGSEHAHLHFCLLYESLVDPTLRELKERYPGVEVGIYPGEGRLSVHLRGEDVTGFQEALLERFGGYHYSAAGGQIAEALQEACVKRGKRVAFAESCSGGQMAAYVTAVPGASDYFLGSFVVYSNAMKEGVLGVSGEALKTHGAVSEETVREMVRGVFEGTGADYAVAVSGVAGPGGGSEAKPVGTVYAAVAERGGSVDVAKMHIPGDRKKIIHVSAQNLLGVLWRKVVCGASFPDFWR